MKNSKRVLQARKNQVQQENEGRNLLIDPFIRISRKHKAGSYAFLKVFQGFEKLEVVRKIFGKDTRRILSELRVEIFERDGFMGVSDEDGHIFASGHYLRSGDLVSIYLDVVHELVHVRQFREGKELFDERFNYVDRPTEIEAYKITVNEARRIGLSEKQIYEYLNVPWVSENDHARLARSCGVRLEEISETVETSDGGVSKSK